MELLKKHQLGTGWQPVVALGEGGLRKSTFDILNLPAGDTYEGNTVGFESAFVLLSGRCNVFGEGFSYVDVGKRKDVFSGKPATVYLPCNTSYRIEATEALEIAVCSAASDKRTKPVLIPPASVKEIDLGVGNWTRKAHFVIDQDVDSQYLFLGETVLPPGKWAFPPHRHDNDDLPYEVDMEEIYHFRILPQQGFGVQFSYTDDRSRDEAYLVRNGDTVMIPDGYHPVGASPVDSLYMLWFMAGEKRRFLARPEDDYQWTTKYERFLVNQIAGKSE